MSVLDLEPTAGHLLTKRVDTPEHPVLAKLIAALKKETTDKELRPTVGYRRFYEIVKVSGGNGGNETSTSAFKVGDIVITSGSENAFLYATDDKRIENSYVLLEVSRIQAVLRQSAKT